MTKGKKTRKTTFDQKLRRTYFSPQRVGSYGGLSAIKKAVSGNVTAIKDWLSYQDTYTLHKKVPIHFRRRRVIVNGIHDQHQADLIDLSRLKNDNDGNRYLLTCIDVLSKYVWVIPLKSKTGAALVEAFDTIYEDESHTPNRLQTDKGAEFLNRTFQAFLKRKGIDFFTTENQETKASVVERFNRTLKERLWRYFTKHNSTRYVEVLPHLVQSYNNTYHRSIRRAPASVNVQNQEEVWQTLYGGDQTPWTTRRGPFQIGDRVRISKASRTFSKKYEAGWSEELYRIAAIKRTDPVTYIIVDDSGEQIQGSFYAQELQKVGEKELFRIEKVLKEKKNEVFVKWWGYPDKFNSWIPRKELQQYNN